VRTMASWEEKDSRLATAGLLLFLALVALLLFPYARNIEGADFYDNTSVLTRLNVTNVAPAVAVTLIYDNDSAPPNRTNENIQLTPGTTDTVWCNATVTDLNGWKDIAGFNATFFHITSSSSASDDKNDHYTDTTCINTSINTTSLAVQCSFEVAFFANNGTWTCNVTAVDLSNATGSGSSTKVIDPLYALDINTSVIDYGALPPGNSSPSDVPVRITNFGNMDINISVEGYGIQLHDGLAMDCETGNISVEYEKYAIAPGLSVASMTNLTTNPLPNGISGLTVLQNTNDNGNSTNTTFWKIQVPIQEQLKGYCNGTVIFSALGPV